MNEGRFFWKFLVILFVVWLGEMSVCFVLIFWNIFVMWYIESGGRGDGWVEYIGNVMVAICGGGKK